MKETIRNYDSILENKLEKIRRSSISSKNKDIIIKFKDECFSQGLSKGRVLKYLYYLELIANWLNKDFDICSKPDIKKVVGKIEQCDYANSTKKELKVCIKKLYKWLRDEEDYPPEVKWIKPETKRVERLKLPEEMLTEDEVKKLINAAAKPRDKAFVAMLYETGCRISELLFMRIRNIKFDRHGAIVIVPGMKTGARRIRIISSVPILAEWLNNHPYKEDPSSYLWIGNHGRVLSYGYASLLLRRLADKAGVKKKVNPHNFRHSRATFLANYLTEAQMKEYFGWTQGSDMAAIYVHLSGRDVDNAILKVYGIKNEEEQDESILIPKTCFRCKQQNPATNKFCSRCGTPLDKEAAMQIISNDMQKREADSILDMLIKDPEFKEIFMSKVKELLTAKTS